MSSGPPALMSRRASTRTAPPWRTGSSWVRRHVDAVTGSGVVQRRVTRERRDDVGGHAVHRGRTRARPSRPAARWCRPARTCMRCPRRRPRDLHGAVAVGNLDDAPGRQALPDLDEIADHQVDPYPEVVVEARDAAGRSRWRDRPGQCAEGRAHDDAAPRPSPRATRSARSRASGAPHGRRRPRCALACWPLGERRDEGAQDVLRCWEPTV